MSPAAALLVGLAREHSRALAGGVAVGLLWRGGQLAAPALTEAAIDRGLMPGDAGALLVWTAALAVTGLLVAITTGARHHYAGRAGYGAEASLREALAGALAGSALGAAERTSRVTGDARAVGALFEAAPSNVGLVVALAGATTALIATDPWLAAAGLAPLLALGAVTVAAVPGLRRLSHALQQSRAALGATVGESVSGIQVVQGVGLAAGLDRRFAAESAAARYAGEAFADRQAALAGLGTLATGLGLAGLLTAAAWRLPGGSITPGSIVAASAYLLLLAPAVQGLTWRVSAAVRAWAAAERLAGLAASAPQRPSGSAGLPDLARISHRFAKRGRGDGGQDKARESPGAQAYSTVRRAPGPSATQDCPPDPRPQPGIGEICGLTGHLVFEGVRVSAADGTPCLNLDLAIPAGQRVAVLGASGAGKSLLLALAAGIDTPAAGRVTLDGVAVAALSPEARRRAVAVGFGTPFLFADTVAANIALARPDAVAAEIEAAARAAALHEEILALPHGYATRLGERGLTLSGGQRQRLGLTRALLARPRLLLLDDVTSALDAATEAQILPRLAAAATGRTLVFATSRPAPLALAERVLVLEAGRIVADGAPAELADHPLLRAMAAGGEVR
ncbi:ATP-binding cassette domain-containing protein [Spiribacter halobius]|uniref:ABC transporter ATP-binding protein n=1 Tax=Sediminicurvatus halobius TaxID=2182432 RepID=A0A2U2N259_9GAMM|nr:ABC transporter ATP-binding protein [Spiribacter halobius]PWG63138.1 hypothetical protein DEM34_09825 [Spiribacter halobius]UEX77588.1 ABC transporter ATP-binding protein/permease [Spiribacter halobius]